MEVTTGMVLALNSDEGRALCKEKHFLFLECEDIQGRATTQGVIGLLRRHSCIFRRRRRMRCG